MFVHWHEPIIVSASCHSLSRCLGHVQSLKSESKVKVWNQEFKVRLWVRTLSLVHEPHIPTSWTRFINHLVQLVALVFSPAVEGTQCLQPHPAGSMWWLGPDQAGPPLALRNQTDTLYSKQLADGNFDWMENKQTGNRSYINITFKVILMWKLFMTTGGANVRHFQNYTQSKLIKINNIQTCLYFILKWHCHGNLVSYDSLWLFT